MLYLSELLIEHHELETFERIDVRPPFPDTPENWEDRLEAAFS